MRLTLTLIYKGAILILMSCLIILMGAHAYESIVDVLHSHNLEKNGKAVMVFQYYIYIGGGFHPDTGKPIPLEVVPEKGFPMSLVYMNMEECVQRLLIFNKHDNIFIRPYLGETLKSGSVMAEPAKCYPR